MKHDPLNNRLLDEFPSLKAIYPTIKDGVFDLDTPAYSFYEEIFVPYFIGKIGEHDVDEIRHCCLFIEEMMNQDELSEDVCMQSVLSPLYEKGIELKNLPLGERSRQYVMDWIEI